MKTLKLITTVASVLFVSSMAWAVDFNSIINENTKAQDELHAQIKETVTTSRIAAQNVQKESKSQYIADNNSGSVYVKTKKDMLTFNKEKKHSRASQEQNDKRLAQEFKDLE